MRFDERTAVMSAQFIDRIEQLLSSESMYARCRIPRRAGMLGLTQVRLR